VILIISHAVVAVFLSEINSMFSIGVVFSGTNRVLVTKWGLWSSGIEYHAVNRWWGTVQSSYSILLPLSSDSNLKTETYPYQTTRSRIAECKTQSTLLVKTSHLKSSQDFRKPPFTSYKTHYGKLNSTKAILWLLKPKFPLEEWCYVW